MIQIKNLNKKYSNKEIFKNFSIEFKDKSTYVISGKNGCGKTTLINILTLQDTKYIGEVFVDNYLIQDIKDKETFRFNYFAYAEQEKDLFEELTVVENINFFVLAIDKIKLNFYLEKMNLTNFKKYKYKYLSGGEKQKVKIIISLLQDRKILILDEPTNNLDQRSNDFLYQHIDTLKNKLIIIVDHLFEEEKLKSNYTIVNIEKEKFFKENKIKIKTNYKGKEFQINFKKSMLLFRKNFLKNIVVYIFLIALYLILINVISSSYIGSINFNEFKNNQFDENVLVLSTTRDEKYCQNHFDECTSENLTFNENTISKLKKNENIENVSSFNILNQNQNYFTINENKTINEYINMSDIDQNLIDSYSLIKQNSKLIKENSQINIKNMNLVNPKEQVKKTEFILEQYNYKKILYGSIPNDDTDSEVMIDENLAAYIAKKKGYGKIEEILGDTILVPTKFLIYNKEINDYELNSSQEKIKIKISGIYEPIDSGTSNIIYGYSKDYDMGNYLEQNKISLFDINEKKENKLTKKEYEKLISGNISNIYIEFKSSDTKDEFENKVLQKYPYLSVYSQTKLKTTDKYIQTKKEYENILKQNIFIIIVLIIFSIFIFKGQKKIMKSEKEILKLYGVNKKNQIKLKLYQKIITIIGIILLCAFFLSPIIIINIIVIIIFTSIILII